MRAQRASLADAWAGVRRAVRSNGTEVGLVALTLGLSYAVKSHFSRATADDLSWILAPTAWLTSFVLDRDFVRLPDAGYLSEELSILITPACAGVNFLVVAFAVLAIGFGRRFGTLGAKALWLALSGVLAYAVAIVVNGARIALSVHVSHVAMHELKLSFHEVHRLLGVVTYFGALVVLVVACESAFRRRSFSESHDARSCPASRTGRTLALALFVYIGITLVVPLARGAARSPEYWDHAALVGGATAAVALAAFVLLSFVTRVRAMLRARNRCALTPPAPVFSSASGVSALAPTGAGTGPMEMRSHARSFGSARLRASGFFLLGRW